MSQQTANTSTIVANTQRKRVGKFALSISQLRAAKDWAEGIKTQEQIATEAGVSVRAIQKWRTIPAFREIVGRYRDEYASRVMGRGIADKARRIARMDDRWNRLHQVLDERGQAMSSSTVPGASTGLLMRTDSGYAVDTATLREIRAHEELAAKELGGMFDADRQATGNGPAVSISIAFPVLDPAAQAAVSDAVTIDLPPAQKRLLQRPSDGKQR